MSKAKHFEDMRLATLTMQRQQKVMEGAIELYAALAPVEAEKYGEMARRALDSILDAKRAHGVYFERALRDEED